MKVDEDMRNDREDAFQTDDEENQAERVCDDDDGDDDTESDVSVASWNQSGNCIEINDPTWPQSYRQSVDMLTSVTPPSIGFRRGNSLTRISNSFTSYKRYQTYEDSSPSKPLIFKTNIDQDEVLTPTLHAKSSYSNISGSDLPPQQHQCSYAQSLLNGINILCGIGILTIPYAISEGGWLSLSILFIFGVISCYTGILLMRCLESTPGLHTYPDIGQAAFGMVGRLAISIALYVELYAACVEYVIMMGDNLASLFPNAHVSLGGISLDSPQIFAILGTLVLLPTVWFRDLSLLSYLSAGGVLSTILVAICLVWVGAVDHIGFDQSGTVLNLANLPFAMGIYGFCFSGHSVFPNIYSSMRDPSQFPSVLLVSFICCSILYAGVGICGFLMFGDYVKSQFTLNMPRKSVVSKIAVWTSVATPMSKYALTISPVALSLEELLPVSSRNSYCISLLIRTVIVISTLIIGLTVPFFGFVMALIGSLLAMLVCLIFPCACYLKLRNGRLTKLQIAVCIFIIVFGAVSSFVGTDSAITRIVHQIS